MLSLVIYRRLLFAGGTLLVCYGEVYSIEVYGGYLIVITAGFIQAIHEQKTK